MTSAEGERHVVIPHCLLCGECFYLMTYDKTHHTNYDLLLWTSPLI